MGVKIVERPAAGRTAKADMDAVAEVPGGAEARRRLRRQAELDALKGSEDD